MKIALLGNTPTQLLNQVLKGSGYEENIHFDIHEADYNQVERQLLDATSQLYASNPDCIVIFNASEVLWHRFAALSYADKLSFSDNTLSSIEQMVKSALQRTGTKIIWCNYYAINDAVFGNYANNVPSSFTWQLRKLNFGLMELTQQCKGLFICDVDALQAIHGRNERMDATTYVNTGIVTSLEFLPVLGYNLTRMLLAMKGRFAKCLIIDLDNTMWGGIIGDDGWQNIQVGDLGIGKAFTQLQTWFKLLKERGIILCVCSKNDEAIAKEAFEQNPDMVLGLDDFAVFIANWENKADNIRSIQQLLNIGYDSMVFLDDNAFERNLVRKELPNIIVPELPEDPANYLSFLQQLNLFETISFNEQDGARTMQYQEESKRMLVKQQFTDEAAYLQSLNMVAEVGGFDRFNIPRIAQLTQRSNQFNLRTVRYTEQEVAAIAESDYHIAMRFSLKDDYGSHGLISIVVARIDGHEAFIENWLMSCRVLKRNVERFVLGELVEAAKQKGCSVLIGEYLPTAKNGIVSNHYKDLGFEKSDDKRWLLNISTYQTIDTFIHKETTVHG